MARTPLFDTLERCLSLARAAAASGRDTLEFLEEMESRRATSRRRFLEGSLALAAAAVLPAAPSPAGPAVRERSASNPGSVAIVGAGMAGLHCAWLLRKQGIDGTIYEASTRVGGRMSTARGVMADGQLVELGGELIDTDHEAMRGLAKGLGIALDDLHAGEPPGFRKDVWYFEGRSVPGDEIVAMFRPLAALMAVTMAEAAKNPDALARLDATSLRAWIDGVPDMAPLLRKLLVEAFTGEYGLETEEQSALNLLNMIDYETPDPFRVFGDSDERFHVHAGNDSLTAALAADLAGHIETGTRLAALALRPDGRIRLSLQKGGSVREADVDRVVLALPFTMLRNVALDVPLPPDKMRVIRELGYGTNAKVMGQFTSRVWRDAHHASGSTIADLGFQTLWDTSRGQGGASGILTNFLGGRAGVACGEGTPEERFRATLPGIDAVYPGAAAAYRAGSAVRMHWPTAPFHEGSYACYRPGQWSFQGLEGRRFRNVHFCGEHCSVDYQGFMEGACETGARVAAEILAEAGTPIPAK